MHARPRRPILLGMLAATAMAACSTQPQLAPPPMPPMPAAWQHAATDPDAPDARGPWWAALGDPVLNALIDEALARNRDIARSALRLQQAALQARIEALNAGWRPGASVGANAQQALDAGGSGSVLINGVSVAVPSSPRLATSAGASVTASYEVDLWSRLAASVAAADRAVEAARADVETARWLLTTQVANLYWTLGAVDAKRELARAGMTDSEAGVAAMQLRYGEGKARRADVDRTVQALDDARLKLRTLATQREQATQALALLLDRPDAVPVAAARLPSQDPPDWRTGPPAGLLDQRPDLRGARLTLDAALLRVKVAEAGRYPQLTLNATASASGEKLSQILSNPIANLSAALALPLVDWHRLQSQRDLALVQLDDAALVFRDSLYKALVEVETQFLQRRQIAAETTQVREKVSVAQRTLATARLRHAQGAEALQTVRDAAQVERDTQAALIDLRLRAWLNLVALHKALGGPLVPVLGTSHISHLAQDVALKPAQDDSPGARLSEPP